MDKKYLINHFVYLLTTLIAALLIGYVVFHLSGSGESNPSTAIARRITSGQTVTAQGYLFMDEQPLYATAEGSLYSPLSEGEKVYKGAEVAKIYHDPEGVLESIALYNKVITLFENAKGSASAGKIDVQLAAITAELRRDCEGGKAEAVARKTEQLQVLLNLRKVATGQGDGLEEQIALLKQKKASLEKSLGKEQEVILAPEAGNYYSSCDGYEEILTAALAESMTAERFLELTATLEKGEAPTRTAGKLRNSSTWYAAFFTESGAAPEMTVGKSYKLTFSDKGVFEMTLARLVTLEGEDGSLLVFRSDVVPPHGLLSRSEQISLEAEAVSGLMVPTAAVRYLPAEEGSSIPDNTGVYVKVGNKLVFKRVRILCRSSGYYVVKEFDAAEEHAKSYLALNDVIVTSGKDLEEGYRN